MREAIMTAAIPIFVFIRSRSIILMTDLLVSRVRFPLAL